MASWGEIERVAPDLARDPRFALPSGSIDPPEAKDELAIDFWSEAGGARSLTRG